MPRPLALRLPALLFVAALVATACSGDSSPSTGGQTSTTIADSTTTTTTPATTSTAPPLDGSALEVSEGCDPLLPDCLLPFPSDAFTVADPATPTGRRIAFARDALPANADGVHVDPTAWNRNDGFSPGSALAVRFPGLDPEASGLAPVTDIGASLDGSAPVVIVDADTGERWPWWAELDAHAGDEEPLLYIRPARNFPDGHHIVVGLRGLVDTDGDPIAPTETFRAYRDGLDTGITALETRRPGMETVFAALADAGVERSELQLAWDFTVISTENLTGPLVALRDRAFAVLGEAAPAFTVDSVTPSDTAELDRVVTGTYEVPLFLTDGGAPGSSLVLDDEGLPTITGTYSARFVCGIAAGLDGDRPGRPLIYGHGLLGEAEQATSSGPRKVAAESGRVVCGTDLIGMANDDVVNAAASIADFSHFPTLVDRLLQGHLNTLVLGRLLIHPDGLAADPAFAGPDGRPLLATGPDAGLAYMGISQGGIMGSATTAVATDWNRAVLGVPAINYSTLLHRSVDFDPFFDILATSYPSTYDQGLALLLVQMLWDRGEGDGYANHLSDDLLPGIETPRRVLIHEAVGDHQVANVATEVLARTVGAAIHWPAVAEGRSLDVEPFWGIPRIEAYPYEGSALVVWDSGQPLPPPTNVPPRDGDDPHDDPRGEPAAVTQRAVFLDTGRVVDTCAGAPCTAEVR